jgi:hypothetical protein
MQRGITKYSTRINRNAWNPRSMPPTPPAPTQHRDHHFSHTHKKTFQPIGASNHQFMESYGKMKFGNNIPWWKRGSLEEIFNNPSSHFLLLLFLHNCWRSQKPISLQFYIYLVQEWASGGSHKYDKTQDKKITRHILESLMTKALHPRTCNFGLLLEYFQTYWFRVKIIFNILT